MDMQMPEMDGIEATVAIRKLPGKTGAIPIMGVTANACREDQEKCRRAGMQDIVTKPFRWSDLIDRMIQYLPPTVPPSDDDPLAGLAVANVAPYRKLVEDVGEEAARSVVDVFLSDARARLQRMSAHVGAGARQALAAEAHALKGSVDLLGFERLTFAASMLELAVEEEAEATELARMLETMHTEFAAVERSCAERLGAAA
jgi:CheY-like chemotaxis protein